VDQFLADDEIEEMEEMMFDRDELNRMFKTIKSQKEA